MESKPYPLNDGDILQLGIDFKGGEEQIFRCVKIRVELNRTWQKGFNNFKYAINLTTRHLWRSTY
jgi:pSer/pThr/pTyr-binding forkhead associated (FHA) protein